MRKGILLSLLIYGAASQMPSFAEDVDAAPEVRETMPDQGLAERLGAVFDDAINSGLLDPSGTTPEANRMPRLDGDGSGEAVTPLKSPPKACAEADRIDFESVSDLKVYGDLGAHVENVDAEYGRDSDEAIAAIATAHLALGLYPESELLFSRVHYGKPIFPQRIARLLDGRNAPDLRIFKARVGCDKSATIWLATALLAQNAAEGGVIMAELIPQFRRLPLQLRVDVTAISVPALSYLGERELAHRMLASFSQEEMESASRLNFSTSLLEAGDGDLGAKKVLESYMSRPEHRVAAAAALVRFGKPVPDQQRHLLLDQLIADLGRNDVAQNSALKIRLALEQMSAISDYSKLNDLLRVPNLQTVQEKNEIQRRLIELLELDLASKEPKRYLGVVDVLLRSHQVLGQDDQYKSLYVNALGLLVRDGYDALSAELAQVSNLEDQHVSAEAQLAYRADDGARLYQLAQQNPNRMDITILAAKAAIKTNNAAHFSRLEAKLKLNADTVVPLIEADALSGHWLVPYAFYAFAAEIDDEEHQDKITRILEMRKRSRGSLAPRPSATLSNTKTVLDNSAQSLAALQGASAE